MSCDNKKHISEYREDCNYLPELRNFTRKDLLLLALYQEWVRTRYNKPTTYVIYILSSLSMVIASFALFINMQDSIIKTIISGATIFLIVLSFYMLWMNKKSESLAIKTLNSIRDAIEEFSKTK